MTTRTMCMLAGLVLAAGATGARAQDVKLGEEKAGMASRAKVTFEVAKSTALARIPGATLLTAELEEEDGKLIYSLVYQTAGKKGVDEVNIDALTGKIVGVEHEKDVPKPEKAEKKEEKRAEKKGGVADSAKVKPPKKG